MEEMIKSRLGFTLIESLTVVAIIGILVSLGIYMITQAQRQARDATRKSDVAAIAQGFEARFLDKTCATESAVGQYPGTELPKGANGRYLWRKVSELSSAVACNPFSDYLPTIPTDPSNVNAPYYFNLSAATGLDAKHYRLAAQLEKKPSGPPETPGTQWAEICRLSDVWVENFFGEPYDNCSASLPPPPQCDDGIDNDNDTFIDLNDPGCTASTDDDETDSPGGGGGGGASSWLSIEKAYAWTTCGPKERWSSMEGECVPNTGGGGGTTEEDLLLYNYYIGR